MNPICVCVCVCVVMNLINYTKNTNLKIISKINKSKIFMEKNNKYMCVCGTPCVCVCVCVNVCVMCVCVCVCHLTYVVK